MTYKDITESLKNKIRGPDYQYFDDNDILEFIIHQQTEIENLNIELNAIYGVSNSLKTRYEEAQAEIKRLTINMNAFGLGMKLEKERADRAKTKAVKELTEKIKSYIECYVVIENSKREKELFNFIDNITKEIIGED